MFKKLNTKTLIVILLILAGIYAVSVLTDQSDRTFENELVAIDTANVQQLVIHFPKSAHDINLFRNASHEWTVSDGKKQYLADSRSLGGILSQFVNMKAERVAATKKASWKNFDITDSTATRVAIKDNSGLLTEVYYGKIAFGQPASNGQNQLQRQQPKVTTYVRVGTKENVYAVDGFLKTAFQEKIDSYRNKKVLKINPAEVNKLSFRSPNQQIELTKSDLGWVANGAQVDSAAMDQYLSKIKSSNSMAFVDELLIEGASPDYRLVFEGNNFNPVEVKAFAVSDTTIRYAVVSDQNADGVFNGHSNDLFEQLFTSLIKLTNQ